MSEAFTVLAILEARDRASEIFAKIDETLGKFSESAKGAGEAAQAAGEQIDEGLGKAAPGADELAAAQQRAAAAARELAAAQRELRDARVGAADADAEDAAQDRLAAAEERVTAATTEEAAAQRELGDAYLSATGKAGVYADAQGKLRDANGRYVASLQDAKGKQDAAGISLAGLGKIAGITAIGMGIAGALMVKAAGNFQDSTTHLVTDAGESARNLGMVQAGILQVSTATGTSASAITDAMYHIESSGLHGAAGLSALRAAAEGAKVGGADLDTVSKTLVGTLTAYYGDTTNAANATQRSTSMMNQLIATVSRGDMRMQDLASSLSNVAPLAASVHLQFSQVGGAIATMTAQGMSAQQATQDLANTIRNLSNPNNVAINEMNQLGINAQDVQQHLGQRGLTGTIGLLTKAITGHMGKSGQVLMSAFTQSTTAGQALKAMLGTMPPQFKSMAEGFMSGKVSAKDWRTEMQAQTPVNAHLMGQFANLYEKSHSFNSLLAAGGPAAQTYTAALAKMMGGATGLNTALMLTGKNAAVFAGNTAAIAEAARKGGSNVDNWSTIQGTFNFKLSAAKTAVENTGIAIGSALLPAATRLISALVKVITPIVEWTSHHQTLTEVLFAGVTAIAATIAMIILAAKAYKAVTGAVSDVKKAVQAVGGLFRKAAAEQAAAAQEGAAATEEAAAESAAAEDEAAAESSGSWLASFAKTTAGAVASAARTVAAWAATGAQMIAQGVAWVASGIAKVAVYVATNVAGALATAAAWMIANAAMLLGIGLIVVAVAAAVYLIVTHWKQISDFAKKAFDDVLSIVESVIGWVRGHWPLLLAILTGPIGMATLFIVGHWRQILGAVSGAIDWVRSHWPLLLAIITGPIGAATTFVVRHWDQIVAGAQHMIGAVTGFFSSLPGRILSALGDLGSLLFGAGQRIVQGLINGVMSMVGAVANAVSSVVGEIKNHLPFSPAKKGPLSGAGAPEKSGAAITRNIALGMRQGIPVLTAVARQVAGAAALNAGASALGLPGGIPALSAISPGAGGGVVNVNLDLRGTQVMSDRDMDALVNRVGTAVATRILPAAGVRVRF